MSALTEWCPRCRVHHAIAGQLCPACEDAPQPPDDMPDTPGDRRVAFGSEGPL